eukprot:CAMPEP_0171935822 /NCGR_PEP_ID=MMETSP0993-20121228/33272_1 /TAXON_ID=483369 /ORGANISM="non described non described, Strain CCMP2098" /LENGTH=878 /DNA_ID=CAMNT_0012576839 /DNA_START=263 /DNA_END=2899 /DNA_ORIENTATION=+
MASPSFQVLDLALNKGPHTLHVVSFPVADSRDNKLLPDGEVGSVQEPFILSVYVEPPAPGPRVLFVSPAYGEIIALKDVEGSLLDSGELTVSFQIVGGGGGGADHAIDGGRQPGSWPVDSAVVISVAGQGLLELGEETDSVDLSGLEPGTHELTATVVHASTRQPLGGGSTTLLFDVVLHPNAMPRHRHFPPPPLPHSFVFGQQEETHSPPLVPSSPLQQQQPFGLSATERPSLQHTTATTAHGGRQGGGGGGRAPWRVTYVGMLKFDGQKTIWLHQMRYLPRELFQLRFLTFSQESANDDAASPMVRHLRELAVPLQVAPIPGIAFEDLRKGLSQEPSGWWLEHSTLPAGSPGPFKWPLTPEELEAALPTSQESLNPILIGALARAGGNVSAVTPPFAKALWTHLTDSLLIKVPRRDDGDGDDDDDDDFDVVAPDLVVFANSRDASDTLLVTAARALGAVVVEKTKNRQKQRKKEGTAGVFPSSSPSSSSSSSSPKLVMDLPNLWPWKGLSVDCMVAPSHFVATHPSVLEATAGSAVPVHVINPGVNESAFDASNKRRRERGQGRPGRGNGGGGGGGDDYAEGEGGFKFVHRRRICSDSCASATAAINLRLGLERKQQQQQSNSDNKRLPLALTSWGCGVCPVVGFLARLAPEKSVGLFLHAAKTIRQRWPFANFLVIGDGPSRPGLEAFAQRLELGDAVTFVGGVYDQNALAALMNVVDVLVNPSLRAWSETFCIANIEALAAGVPVVSFAVGGVGEYFLAGDAPEKVCETSDSVPGSSCSTHKTGNARKNKQLGGGGGDGGGGVVKEGGGGAGNGVVAWEPTPESLASGVLTLLRNQTLREQVVRSARDTVMKRFTVELEVKRYQELYSKILLSP